ncbi:choice-of-anchor J domain-containing protein [Flavobacterium sp. HNIBRBA15423]|uniref:choice-of-anchor J domain-containing protein n=1 Tax=Flavobacterium sp. HNIBRBA15423 TaxID=3458683 RepID=UPI004044572E
MKNKFTLFLIFILIKVNSQIILSENFDNFGNLGTSGWTINNSSEPVGTSSWGTTTAFSPYNGSTGSFAAVNYQSTGSIGTISNWLITPSINLKNGDIISFYSRSHHGTWPDRLELRISLNGPTSALPTSSSSSVGDFTTLALTINPNLIASGYPNTWTNYTYTINGLSQPTDCRVAFRYYVTDAGANASNGDMIGIDALNITTDTLANILFETQEITISPNPTTDFITINNFDSNMNFEFYDLLGKKLTPNKVSENKFDVSLLLKGTYIIKITYNDQTEIQKFIKQ